MSELKELFDMVTNKTEPDLDSWKEQEDRQRRTSRNRKLGAFVATAAVVVVGVIAFASFRDTGDGGETPMGSPTESSTGSGGVTSHYFIDLATGERTKVPVYLGQARLPEVSPNGQRIVYGTCCTSADALFVAALDGSSDPVQITPEDLNGYSPSWIDDETILFQGRRAGTIQLGDLYTANVSTGEITMVTNLPDEANGSWIITSDLSPDGSTVLFHLPRGKGHNAEWDLWTAPLAGGERTLLREDAGFATYAPDGSVVFLDHPDGGAFNAESVWIMDGGASGGTFRTLASGSGLAFPEISPDGTMLLVGSYDGPAIVDIATGEVTAIDGLFPDDEPAWYGNDTVIS